LLGLNKIRLQAGSYRWPRFIGKAIIDKAELSSWSARTKLIPLKGGLNRAPCRVQSEIPHEAVTDSDFLLLKVNMVKYPTFNVVFHNRCHGFYFTDC
jgi:hypothetical protein